MKSSFARIAAAGTEKISKTSEKINLLWHAMYSHQMQFTAYKQGGNRINYHIENCSWFFLAWFLSLGSLCLFPAHFPVLCAFHSRFGQEIFELPNRAHQLIQVRCCANKYTICVYSGVNICHSTYIGSTCMAIKKAHRNKRAKSTE